MLFQHLNDIVSTTTIYATSQCEVRIYVPLVAIFFSAIIRTFIIDCINKNAAGYSWVFLLHVFYTK